MKPRSDDELLALVDALRARGAAAIEIGDLKVSFDLNFAPPATEPAGVERDTKPQPTEDEVLFYSA